MKTTLKLLMAVLMTGWCGSGYAQTYEWQKPVKQGEKELEMALDTFYAGFYTQYGFQSDEDHRKYPSVEELYKHMYDKVKKKIGDEYPNFALRQFKSRYEEPVTGSGEIDKTFWFRTTTRYYYLSAIIVIPDKPKPVENPLSKAIDKALGEVREGSRIAIDQIRVPTGTDKEYYKDEVVEALLDKGFKVVAKEYLERLYEEQQDQQSGVYNDKTTVKDNNFSAVGYYLNVKLTDTALRVQVINVSTGEYEGNVTIKLQQ